MKSLLFVIVFVMISGCSTAPIVVKQKFPEPPELLMRPVPELKKLE